MISNDVLTLSGWKSFIESKIAKLYELTRALIEVYERAKNIVGKTFDEINDELLRRALVSGLREDGSYDSHALALLYRDFVGIELEDPKLLIRLLQQRREPKVKVYSSSTFWLSGFWKCVNNIHSLCNFILRRSGIEPKNSVKIEKPRGFAERLEELINLFIELVPQHNEFTFFAFSLAHNTDRYLRELSKEVYPGLYDNKELQNWLGLSRVVEMPDPSYSLWGYRDYLTYDQKSYRVRGLHIDSMEAETIGGALCMIVENIFYVMRPHDALKRWFNYSKDLELEYAEHACKALRSAEPRWRLPEYLTMGFTSIDDIRVRYSVTKFITDENFVVRFYTSGYSRLELANKFTLMEFLDDFSPLMFLRLVNLCFVEPPREFLILVRPSYDDLMRVLGR